MIWLIIIGGFTTLAFFAFCFYWIFGIGKQIKEGEEMARLVDIERRYSDSIKRWAKDVDRLADENAHLKKELSEEFHRGPSLSNVVHIIKKARGVRKGPPPDGTDGT